MWLVSYITSLGCSRRGTFRRLISGSAEGKAISCLQEEPTAPTPAQNHRTTDFVKCVFFFSLHPTKLVLSANARKPANSFICMSPDCPHKCQSVEFITLQAYKSEQKLLLRNKLIKFAEPFVELILDICAVKLVA